LHIEYYIIAGIYLQVVILTHKKWILVKS